ncbi:hypothetical protein ACFU51_31945 [Streptomyces sp. NPDC057430]|uniref:hypothetical protein n=1 Tax=Streptomyces sp. NPDC057430 TaxID=3346131 RepID=UPI00368A8665
MNVTLLPAAQHQGEHGRRDAAPSLADACASVPGENPADQGGSAVVRAAQHRRLVLLQRLAAVPVAGPISGWLAEVYLRCTVRQMVSRARLYEDRTGAGLSPRRSAPPGDRG